MSHAMIRSFVFVGIFLLALACRSEPPTEKKLQISREHSSRWGAQYAEALKLAATQPEKSCAIFRILSNDSVSNIAALAQARAIEFCADVSKSSKLEAFESLFDNSQLTWLSPLLSEKIVELAQTLEHKSALAKHAFSHAKTLSSQREKEILLKAGRDAARDLGLNDAFQKLETELYRVAPRLQPNPPASLWFKVASDFRTNEAWPEALRYYQLILQQNSPDLLLQFRSLDGIRNVHKSIFRFYEGPLEAFLKAAKEASNFARNTLANNPPLLFPDKALLMEGWLQYARDEWSYGDVEIAKEEVQQAINSPWLDPIFRAYANWLESRIYANYSEWEKAARAAQRASELLMSEIPHSRTWTPWHWNLFDDILWAGALAYRKTEQWQRAMAMIQLALDHSPNPNSRLKFLFWLAQCQFDLKEDTQAKATLATLAELDPFNYYGFLAHRELNKPLSPLPDLDPSEVEKPRSINDGDFFILLSLTDADEFPLAQRFSRQALPSKSAALDELLLRAHVRDFSTIWTLFFTVVDPTERNQLLRNHARLLYPEPYLNIVSQAVNRHPILEKEYVYSIMRQESGFDPSTHSWANAYGLLQLLPRVAREVQEKAGVWFEHDYELFRPEINIPLGVAHMEDIFSATSGSFILRTASYNGTMEKALEWKERLYQGRVYEFLEEIPYEETRLYVRLVLRNYLMNLRLSAKAPFLIPGSLLNLE